MNYTHRLLNDVSRPLANNAICQTLSTSSRAARYR